MTCGHLGCGRKYYDGSGGNNHAAEHFDTHKSHAVACKLGTITPEGNACKKIFIILCYSNNIVALYCYACNDDVNDPSLADHMEKIGIDIRRQTKTEKTITELVTKTFISYTFIFRIWRLI